jgi:pantoate--beta-alanine ligase
MQSISASLKKEGKVIGLVPTMGFLHQGHLSLVRESKAKTDITVVSIFVNPTQFGPNEDFSTYPRDTERDCKLLEAEGVDYVIIPAAESIYTEGAQTYVNVTQLGKKLEGEFRPTHFQGVATVVTILFNIVRPDMAFFGQKDAQQATLLVRMEKDLHLGISINVCKIMRESDGLALSSRNIYLSPSERVESLVLHNSLLKARDLIDGGERHAEAIIDAMKGLYGAVQSSSLDYIKIVEDSSFDDAGPLETGKAYYILIACKIGKTRLIDNLHARFKEDKTIEFR